MEFSSMLVSNDLMKFSKEDLQKIATQLNITVASTKIEMASEIYTEINKSPITDETIKSIVDQNLLAGKVSVKWYKVIEDWSAEDVKQKLISTKDIFRHKRIPSRENLDIKPIIFTGFISDNKEKIYLRFIYKASVKNEMYGDEINTVPTPGYSTVLIDFKNKVLEYRGDSKKAKDVILQLLKIFNGEPSNEMLKEIFPESLDDVLKKLDGELLDTLASTDKKMDLSKEQLEGISKVLNGLDEYFRNQELKELEAILIETNDLFENNLSNELMPFSSTILSGLETISLGSGKDIRKNPMFKYLDPNLNHNAGYIKIKHVEDGIENSYTLRASISSKSLYFNSPVNESILSYVRRKIVI
ncbi:hypothetical protein ROU88_00910 [Macrococcus capreoli]|uniref:hypothetical protein n=1 Tax=Macrococcus capreoli TaxID=2982690 RepID=UPI0021D5CEF0|nr:hypothetical protein [Macrococcus sp. TMW 2.2395]MCU7556677.1 hypothetical protein [Macrococcus sp. TMW 2.2395]